MIIYVWNLIKISQQVSDIWVLFNIKIKAAEAGNLDEFVRLYQFDNSRLIVKDGKGRTVVHQAAARNKVNILEFICEQNGGETHQVISIETIFLLWFSILSSQLIKLDLNVQDQVGNTPLHSAVENDSFDAIEFLLQM